MPDPVAFLERVFRAGVEGANPERATRQAVAAIGDLAPDAWVLAIGKGAHGMASGAVSALAQRGVVMAGGFVIAQTTNRDARHGLDAATGDHPVPGPGSFQAASRLARVAEQVPPDHDAIVLISGGATSLAAAPVEGVSNEDLGAMFTSLLASGADIGVMNAIRKRVLRFGAGRLALALHARRIHCLIASDVIGNDPASIGSGPCVPDSATAGDARARAMEAGAWEALPAGVRKYVDSIVEGRVPESRPDLPRFATTTTQVVLSREDAEHGAAKEAHRNGLDVEIRDVPLSGEASDRGAKFGRELATRPRSGRPGCVIWSGETTVTLGESQVPGGRCQEFALACALELESAGHRASGITVLAAGTDGRDGPTDAAGAIVNSATCAKLREAGFDPVTALREHSSHDALRAAGALLKTGPTGTNVNDLVIALIQ